MGSSISFLIINLHPFNKDLVIFEVAGKLGHCAQLGLWRKSSVGIASKRDSRLSHLLSFNHKRGAEDQLWLISIWIWCYLNWILGLWFEQVAKSRTGWGTCFKMQKAKFRDFKYFLQTAACWRAGLLLLPLALCLKLQQPVTAAACCCFSKSALFPLF